ncbi:MAG TPA: HAD family phosphatase [Candidatus Saccharimonadales bacterium]|nr:HAD family phosphatase [Candidatus Saccharimonadales bacterium]
MIEAVIFDLDGVLIDSVPAARRMRTKVLADYGVDLQAIPDPMNEQHRGSSAKDLLAAVKKHTGMHIDLETYGQRGVQLIEEDLLASGASADPELLTFLRDLKDHGVPLAIASSGLRPTVLMKLKLLNIADYFKIVVTANEATKHKPDPEAYERAATGLGVVTSNCIAFEDSTAGATSAVAAGCKVIGFTKYNPTQEALPGTVLNIQDWAAINYEKLQQV